MKKGGKGEKDGKGKGEKKRKTQLGVGFSVKKRHNTRPEQ